MPTFDWDRGSQEVDSAIGGYYISYYTDVSLLFGSYPKLLILLEAAIGIEPMNKGFADLCLTTWLRRQN